MKNIVAVETAKSIDEACVALEKAIAAHQFGILHVHNVRQTLANKGVALNREVRIFDVCNIRSIRRSFKSQMRCWAERWR